MRALKAKCPNWEFGVTNQLDSAWVSRETMDFFHEVWVYRPGDVYAMGVIGVTPDNDATYRVFSKSISNDKYRSHNVMHRAKQTQNLNKAVSLALKHLIPYNPIEVVEESKRDFAQKYASEIRDADRGVSGTRENLRYGEFDELLDDVVRAYREGLYVPQKAKIKEEIDKYLAAQEAQKQQEGRMLSAYAVTLTERGGKTYANFIRYIRMESKGTPREIVELPVEDLPEDIAGKIAVLNMVDNNHYVDGVGMRITPQVYWLARHDMTQDEMACEV
jgi:hypothetical protein